MLIRTSKLKNYRLLAKDGEIGRCRDFLFDDRHWVVRYMEANTGKWLLGRRVLISPIALCPPVTDERQLPLDLDKQALEDAPGIATDQPVSRQYEVGYMSHFGYGYYWHGEGIWGAGPLPYELARPSMSPDGEGDRGASAEGDPHLRSAAEVRGYTIAAENEDLGKVDDLIVDTENWSIAYFVLDTRRWLPGKTVLLPVGWISHISWAARHIRVDVTADDIKSAPPLTEPIEPSDEQRFFAHFSRPGRGAEAA